MSHKTLQTFNLKFQDPRCCTPKQPNPKPRPKSKKKSKNTNKSTYKSAPSSPVGTPRRFVNQSLTPSTTPKKKELPLSPQWITAFPTVETPSESGYPVIKPSVTGCCGKRSTINSAAKRRQRSNSYSALDSTSDDGIQEDSSPKGLPKKQVILIFK